MNKKTKLDAQIDRAIAKWHEQQHRQLLLTTHNIARGGELFHNDALHDLQRLRKWLDDAPVNLHMDVERVAEPILKSLTQSLAKVEKRAADHAAHYRAQAKRKPTNRPVKPEYALAYTLEKILRDAGVTKNLPDRIIKELEDRHIDIELKKENLAPLLSYRKGAGRHN